MLPDNRLDFITGIEPQFLDMMTELRKEYIALDTKIRAISSMPTANRVGVNRCLSIARTDLETACQYTIKALCIMGEFITPNDCDNKNQIEQQTSKPLHEQFADQECLIKG